MKKIIFLLACMLMASCSRIVTTDYELLDSGEIVEVGLDLSVSVISAKDSVCRKWLAEIPYDEFSLWDGCYTDSLKVGDKCFVYDGGTGLIISKVSVEDAKLVNAALCRQYWKELLVSERLIVCILMALTTMGFWLFSQNNEKNVGIGMVMFLLTTVVAVLWMAPGRKLEKVGSGEITEIEKKCFTLDGKSVYYTSSTKDVFGGGELAKGMNVNVYRYSRLRSGIRENMFLSVKDFAPELLAKTQIYPEVVYKTIGVYWLLLFVCGGIILPFMVGWKRKKSKKA